MPFFNFRTNLAMANRYLSKHARKSAIIADPPSEDLGLVVVIPAFDEPDLHHCLTSLIEADRPNGKSVEVIVVINFPETADAEIVIRSHAQQAGLTEFCTANSDDSLHFHIHLEVFTGDEAGVGLARKIGMDEAVRRFEYSNRDGLIVNLDADCSVASNYFQAIIESFRQKPEIWAAGIHFEHPISHDEDPIIDYELHLRYFIEAQRFIKLPFAFQTVGSCMAVRSSAYQKLGGMNVRKAGEDFYFLHKFIAINRFMEINDTTVFPSARVSSRVPFGTGRAMKSRMEGAIQLTYNLQSFYQLAPLLNLIPDLYQTVVKPNSFDHLPEVILLFLRDNQGFEKINEIKRETAQFATYIDRFFQWFNAFRLMKYLHFARAFFPDQPVKAEAGRFYQMIEKGEGPDTSGLLLWYRARAKRL